MLQTSISRSARRACPYAFRTVATTTSDLKPTSRRKTAKERSVEDEFKRLTPLEHILKCPNMYIGATSMTEKTKSRYLVSSLSAKSVAIERADTPFIPGLVKIFDEVLVNACDNAVRDPAGTDRIDVTFDSRTGKFVIRNTGEGIPIKLHEKENMYVPELVLGNLLTGSNFEKAEANSTGGRHGYGAKLCNVFSTEFSVQTVDSKTGLCFVKRWKDNMTQDGSAEIVSAKGSEPFTEVSFTPDWARFGLKKIDPGSLSMMRTRVVETAGLLGPKVKVTWNEKQVPVSSFEEFCEACAGKEVKLLYHKAPYLRVGLGLSTEGFSDNSFVNSMSTWRGGSHVESIVDQIVTYLNEHAKRPANEGPYGEREIKKHLNLFVDFRTNHPEFDSQSKDRLTSSLVDDQHIKLPVKFLKQFVTESGIIDALQSAATAKVAKQVNKRVSVHLIPKLEDAFKAGTSESRGCTLILTEGDSAKALAMEGIAVVGRKHYGVYPLRGKLLNVRDRPMKDVAENLEVRNIMNALGLKVGAKTMDGLRYGRVMFMTDQDHDGSHIKGLLLNLFDHFWPTLAQQQGFLTQFITPLLKAKPRSLKGQVLEFYNQQAFESWTSANPTYKSDYRIKYYKGLGTSTAQEARESFGKLDRHVVDFRFERGNLDRELIDKVFKSERSAERKDWLRQFRADVSSGLSTSSLQSLNPSPLHHDGPDSPAKHQSIENFINTDVAGFSWHDVERSIPSVLDGLKPSQRKVFFALLQKSNGSVTEEIKVAQLAGYVAEVTAYHHGEKSLVDTIVNMAQDYVGANNLPLLRTEGQFGTRLQGGKDAAAGRYIFTGLSPVARMLFPMEDDALLERRVDDGVEVEPKTYVPIIPLILVNGAEGIGTGWSTSVPAHHPLEVAERVEALVRANVSLERESSPAQINDLLSPLKPWYKGFKGSFEPESTVDRVTCRGVMTIVPGSKTTPEHIDVSELPLGIWTDDYKQRLVTHVETGRLSDFRDISTNPSQVHFQLFGSDLSRYVNEERNKLRTFLDMRNMHLFDQQGAIQRYTDAREIIWSFYKVRLALYERRRMNILKKLGDEIKVLTRELELTRRILPLNNANGETKVLGRSLAEFVTELTKLGFTKFEVDRFLRKPIGDFTAEKVKELEKVLAGKEKLLAEFLESTAQSLWLKDLKRFRESLIKFWGLQEPHPDSQIAETIPVGVKGDRVSTTKLVSSKVSKKSKTVAA